MTDRFLHRYTLILAVAVLTLALPLAAQQQGFPPRLGEEEFESATGQNCNIPPSSTTPSADGVVYWDDHCDFTLGTMKGYEILPPENIDWLGAGFDITLVDPAQFGNSRGRKRSPIRLVTSGGRVPDQTYFEPHGTEFASGAFIEGSSEVQMITSLSSYRRAFAADVKGGLDLAGLAAFSASASHERATDSRLGSETLWMIERRDVELNRVELLPTWIDESTGKRYRHRLNPDFRRAVSAIRAAPASDWVPPPIETRTSISDYCEEHGYSSLIDAFGTHYSRYVLFGGQFHTETEVDRSEFLRSELSKSAFQAAVSGQIKKIGGSLEGGYRQEVGRSRGGSTENQRVRHWHTGGSASQDYETWAKSVANNPMPVQIGFAPLTDLLTSRYFPDDPIIDRRRKGLKVCIEDRFLPYRGLDISASGEDFWRAPPAPVWQNRAYRVSFKEITSLQGGPLSSYQISGVAKVYRANQQPVYDDCNFDAHDPMWWRGPEFFVQDGDFPRKRSIPGSEISRYGILDGDYHLEIRDPADLDVYLTIGACVEVSFLPQKGGGGGGLDRSFGIESAKPVHLSEIAVGQSQTAAATAYHGSGDEIWLEVEVRRIQ